MSTDAAKALRAVEDALASYEKGTPAEREAMHDLADALRAMREKIAAGRVTLAVFGEISTGKSSLVNALLGRDVSAVDIAGGTTREVGGHPWRSMIVPGLEGSEIEILDTPGINEVDGEVREAMAAEAARRADLILFVTDSDLNHAEHDYLARLAASSRHVLMVLNKADLYTAAQRDRLVEVLAERARGVGGSVDIVAASANPMEREVVRELPGGREVVERRKPKPDVEEVELAILRVLRQEGRALVALNASLFAAETSDRIIVERLRLRGDEADRLVWKFAAAKALTVGLNPVPVLDAVGGVGVDAAMVLALSRLYGVSFTTRSAHALIGRVVLAAGWVVGIEGVTHLLSHVVKALSFGAGTVATAAFQGAAAGYTSTIVGKAATAYFANGGSWAAGGPKKVVEEIIKANPKGEVTGRLAGQIREAIRRNRAAKVESSGTTK